MGNIKGRKDDDDGGLGGRSVGLVGCTAALSKFHFFKDGYMFLNRMLCWLQLGGYRDMVVPSNNLHFMQPSQY